LTDAKISVVSPRKFLETLQPRQFLIVSSLI
jgi:hypothetical protein